MIVVINKKRKIEKIQEEYPGAYILDITSSSPYKYGKLLSPFYPHKNIPIPGKSKGMTADSVEGIWQGLKVFEKTGIDIHSFRNDSMKNIKRTVRKFGRPLGHQYGVYSKNILNYSEAKRLIYVPAYKYVLENVPEVKTIIKKIRMQAEISDIILLDYNLNPDNRNSSAPLSHAELVKMYIEGRYPEKEEDFLPWIPDTLKSFNKVVKKKIIKERVKVSAKDLPNYLDEIVKILKNNELTVSDLTKFLGITITTKTFKVYLENVPNIIIIKIKNKIVYTLKSNDQKFTLF